MKQYDREKKKWVSEEEYARTHQPRDKQFCRGKKPHDYVLVLPNHVTHDSTYKFNPESYYKVMDEKFEALEQFKEKIKALGVVDKYGWNRKETRLYMCAVCKKQKYEAI